MNCYELAPHGTQARYRGRCRCGDCRAAHNEHMAVILGKHQTETQAAASRHRQPWTDADMQVITREDLTVKQIALELGRTFSAVRQQRTKIRKAAA